mgnify:CR=1 FL=1
MFKIIQGDITKLKIDAIVKKTTTHKLGNTTPVHTLKIDIKYVAITK